LVIVTEIATNVNEIVTTSTVMAGLVPAIHVFVFADLLDVVAGASSQPFRADPVGRARQARVQSRLPESS
jgi:hypothetical protein